MQVKCSLLNIYQLCFTRLPCYGRRVRRNAVIPLILFEGVMSSKLLLFLLFSFVFLSCNDKEAELNTKIKELETKLDDCENGSEKLLARMKISFENEDFATCKNIFNQMEKRHPDSQQFIEVKNIYLKVIDIENKRNAEAKLKIENEKKEKLKALNKLKKDYDDVSGITWYKQPYFTHYTNTFLTSIYLGQENSKLWLRLQMTYEGDNWIFFDNAYLSYESITKEIYFDEYRDKKSDSGYGGRVWEWIDVTVSDDLENFLRDFAKSKDAKMRFSGKYTKTRNLGAKEKQGILDVLNALDVLRNQ